MLKRVEHNFIRFNEQLQQEIRDEEGYEHDLLTSTSMINTHNSLEELYAVAGNLKDDLNNILEQSRNTFDQIVS